MQGWKATFERWVSHRVFSANGSPNGMLRLAVMSFNTFESQLHTDVAWLQALSTACPYPILTFPDPGPKSAGQPHGDTSQVNVLAKVWPGLCSQVLTGAASL